MVWVGFLSSIVMGNIDGIDENFHGHVTALTVSPLFRRLGIAEKLMQVLEDVSDRKNAYFVDLFVRPSNALAVSMYKKREYVIYRTILDYYSGDASTKPENAYGRCVDHSHHHRYAKVAITRLPTVLHEAPSQEHHS